jgi:hypothetical protein
MQNGNWWQRRSRPGKTLAVLAAMLLIEVALLLSTPALSVWIDDLLHIPRGEQWGTFGAILWELLLSGATVVAIVISAVWWLIKRHKPEGVKEGPE